MTTFAGPARLGKAIVAKYGSTVRLRQLGTPTQAANGSDITGWVSVPQGDGRLLLKPVTVGQAQRLWGAEAKGDFVGYCAAELPVAAQQGLLVEGGDYSGKRFRVVQCEPFDAIALLQVELELTTETFA